MRFLIIMLKHLLMILESLETGIFDFNNMHLSNPQLGYFKLNSSTYKILNEIKPKIITEMDMKIKGHVGVIYDITNKMDTRIATLSNKYQLFTNFTGSRWYPTYSANPRFENYYIGSYVGNNFQNSVSKSMYFNTNSFLITNPEYLVDLKDLKDIDIPEKQRNYLNEIFKICKNLYEGESNATKRKEIEKLLINLIRNEINIIKSNANLQNIEELKETFNFLGETLYLDESNEIVKKFN